MKVLKNYFFSSSYQLLVVVVPFITTPYLSRVLGKQGVGLNAFTLSVVGFFVLFATLGTNMYGNREIAYHQNDKQGRSQLFWEITLLSWLSSVITLAAFLIFICFVHEYKTLYLLQGIAILATMFDVSWYFMGREKFKITVTRNFVIKILTVVSIFMFIHRSSDLYLYVGIMMFGGLMGSLSLWPYLKKEVSFPKIKKLQISRHLKPSILLFFPFISLNVYSLGQKTLVGILDSIGHAGFFFQADNLIKVVLSLVTPIGTVMLPRMSALKADENLYEIRNTLKKNFNVAMGISAALCFGVAGISIRFAPYFFGNQFGTVGYILLVESFALIFMASSNIFQTHYFLPLNKLRILTTSMFLGAIINIILNLITIPMLGVVGAACSVVLTEFLMVVYQFHYLNKEFRYNNFFEGIWKYLFSGGVMFIVVLTLNLNFKMGIISLIIQVFIGSFIYIAMNFLTKTELWILTAQFTKAIMEKYRKHL